MKKYVAFVSAVFLFGTLSTAYSQEILHVKSMADTNKSTGALQSLNATPGADQSISGLGMKVYVNGALNEERDDRAGILFDIPGNHTAGNVGQVKLKFWAYVTTSFGFGPEDTPTKPFYNFYVGARGAANSTFTVDALENELLLLDTMLVDNFEGGNEAGVIKTASGDSVFVDAYEIDVTNWYKTVIQNGSNYIGFNFFTTLDDNVLPPGAGNAVYYVYESILAAWTGSSYGAHSPTLEVTSVPEPLTLISLGLGLSLFGIIKRLKK